MIGALAIQNESDRARALEEIAPRLPESEPQLVQQALGSAQEIQIETCFEEQHTPEKAETTSQTLHMRSPLRDFFQQYRLSEGDRYLQRDFEKLKHDALQTSILPAALTLDGMTHEIFNLIRSFSFVGEIGEDPEDYRISEAEVDDLQ